MVLVWATSFPKEIKANDTAQIIIVIMLNSGLLFKVNIPSIVTPSMMKLDAIPPTWAFND